MKAKENVKKGLVVLALLFALVMSVKGQPKQVIEFQTVMTKHETAYKNFLREGKYKEAISPLTTLINLIDTTNIYKVVNVSEAMVRQLNAPYYYDLACCYAVTQEKKLALKALEQAVSLGYNNYNNMLNDKDLTSLRKDKTYQALLASVKEKILNVLRKSAPYAKDSVKLDIEFTYQPKDDYRLGVVRDYLKLDSVAGQGDELSKIINLLHFAHNEMPHDGNHRAFAEMDAIDLYNYVKTTGKGVNCRQLAISLCEMYLSMGIPARYVTCLPADPNDSECHVINAVWSSQLQKWLWIDPTNDAWVMNENGTMLSIAEVRERMINDQPLVLCETANWNHRKKKTKEDYLYGYMAKNLYYFICKKYNRFNPESDYRDNPAEEVIRLIPVGFVNDNWECDTTTDPNVFWAKPEI
ncbi:MAG: transglutaminase domain-containing protein [Bacteroidaceae bacterium]|nr:transglutaminase domain-containing protein [Bacteroidaceae bacterium]